MSDSIINDHEAIAKRMKELDGKTQTAVPEPLPEPSDILVQHLREAKRRQPRETRF